MNEVAAPGPLSILDVLKEDFTIDPNMRVSENSRYKDPVWDFRSPGKHRSNSVSQSRLVIPWEMYCTPVAQRQFRKGGRVEGHLLAWVPPSIIEELKVLALFSLKLPPSTFASRGKQNGKPNTVSVSLRAVVSLFSEICASYDALLEGHGQPLITCVADITLEDLRDAIANSPRADGDRLSNYLRRLTHPVMGKYLRRRPEWNKHDLETLDFKFPQQRGDYLPVMKDELFRLVSDTACADIKGFLALLDIEPVDKHPTVRKATFEHSAGEALWELYVEIRRIDRENTHLTGRRTDNASWRERDQMERWYGVTPDQFQPHLARVQRASCMIIGLYTGGRYTDLASFVDGCVVERYAMPMLKGTEVKRRSLEEPEGEDLWPAIPIMLDAVRCLKEISRVTFNPYLVAPTYTLRIGEQPVPLSYQGFVGALNLYLQSIDEGRRCKGVRISANYLRHTLAYNLGRQGVNPVYISIQLKHLDDAFRVLPPDITLGYGDSGQLALLKATGAERASMEAVKELFSVNAPISGGGAPAFRERREAYFAGEMAAGRTEQQTMMKLAKAGVPFVSIGGGYCGGAFPWANEQGDTELPPCLGQMQCNSKRCKQGVITQAHAPHWNKIFSQNTELAADPAMNYAKEHLLSVVAEAREVLEELQLPVS